MRTKRTILACVEAIPTAIAWTLTTLLLVNVSTPILVTLNRGATAAQWSHFCASQVLDLKFSLRLLTTVKYTNLTSTCTWRFGQAFGHLVKLWEPRRFYSLWSCRLSCLRSMPRLTNFQRTLKTHWKCWTISQTSKTSWLRRRLISLKRCAKRSEMDHQPMRKTSLAGRKLRLSKRSFSCLTSTISSLLLASLVTPKLKRKKGRVWSLDWWKASLLP